MSLKKTTIFIFLLVSFSNTFAQSLLGKAEYFSKIIQEKNNENNEEIDPEKKELREKLFEAMKNASEKKYELQFNTSQALYEKIVEMETPKPNTGGISISVSMSNEGKKFMDLKEKKCFIEDDIFGKEFLIVDALPNYDWQMMNETKKIGAYTCYKAQTVKKVTDEERASYDAYLKKNENKKTTGLFKVNEPKDEVITAWYAPEIPVSFGPATYWGLPGLILEVSSDKEIILCTKIELSKSENTEIKKPSTGKKVSQKEFCTIQKKKMDSMKDEDGNIIFSSH